MSITGINTTPNRLERDSVERENLTRTLNQHLATASEDVRIQGDVVTRYFHVNLSMEPGKSQERDDSHMKETRIRSSRQIV